MLQEQVFQSDAFLQEGTKECERSMPTLIASTTHSITRCARTRTGRVGPRKTSPDSVRADTPIRSGPSHSRLSKVNGFYMVDSLPFYCRRRVSPSASASATLCCRSANERHEPPICCALFRRRTLVHAVHPHLRVSLAPLSDFCSWQLFGDK